MYFSSQSAIYSMPAWVSSRTYFGKSAVRSVVINERTSDFYTLDAESARLWSHIEEGATPESLADLALELAVVDDLEGFVASLFERGLISPASNVLANTPDLQVTEPTALAGSPTQPLRLDPNHQNIESEFQDWVLEQGCLWSFFWEMTYRCNERCVHCFNPGAAHSDKQKPKRDTAELTTAEALRMIDDAYEAGAFKVCLSGGEVSIRKDFFEIVEHIRKKRMQLTIYTNGLLFDDEALSRLASCWPTLVGISIYSANPTIHDAITKVPRSHERSMAALRKFRGLGIRTSLKAAIMDQAVQGWQSLEQLARDTHATFHMDIQMTAGNDGAREPMQLNIQSHAELVALAVTKGSSIFVGDVGNRFGRVAGVPDQPVCGAGRSTLSVNPAGDIYTCVAVPMAVGNVRKDLLSELWHGSRYGLRADQPKSQLSRWQGVHLRDYPECGMHEHCQWCHKCPGMGFVESGDPLAPSEVQCRFAVARMTAAKLLEAGETREAIFEKFGVPLDFGTRLEPRPAKHPTQTVTFDRRAIGGRKLDVSKT